MKSVYRIDIMTSTFRGHASGSAGAHKQKGEKMETAYEIMEGKLVIRVPKELDHHQANALRAETDLLIEMYHIRQLMFDFSDTEFMDSSGIGVLIGRYKLLSYKGGTVSAKNLNRQMEKIFQASGLKKIIPVEE